MLEAIEVILESQSAILKKDILIRTESGCLFVLLQKLTFVAFAAFTTIQMKIIGEYIDYTKIAPSHAIAIPAIWILAAATFTLLTIYQINRHYQKPIEDFAKAARKVASGDFSVYVASRHTQDKADYLDVIFMNFNKMVEELGSIETLKTDFFSNVSHEIKTPIAVIQNNAELLQNGNGTEAQQQEYIEAILQATQRLSGLITNMLKLNKLEKQVIQPVSELFDEGPFKSRDGNTSYDSVQTTSSF